VTIAKRPFELGGDGRAYTPDLHFGKSEYFSFEDWTAQIMLIRFKKLVFTCKSISPDGGENAVAGLSHGAVICHLLADV
jgi:hypothetical protein